MTSEIQFTIAGDGYLIESFLSASTYIRWNVGPVAFHWWTCDWILMFTY